MTKIDAKIFKKSLAFIGVFAAYYIMGTLGLRLDAVSHFASFIWAPTGIAFAAIILFGQRVWPAIFAAAFFVNLNTGAPILVALGIGAGNTLEAIVGASLLKRFVNFNGSFSRLRASLGFLFFACVLSTFLSATVGVLSLWLGGQNSLESIGATWGAWWTGDALGDLVVAPLILVLALTKFKRPTLWQATQALAIFVVISVVSFFIMGSSDYPAYWLFPIVVWAGVAFGQRGNVVAIFVIAAVAIFAAVTGRGTFGHGSLRNNLLFLDNFLSVIGLTGMLLASAIEERRGAVRSLERALNAREDFLSIASHELKTPLTALNLQIQVAQQLPDAQTQETFSDAGRQVQRLTRLVDDMFDASRIHRGRFDFNFTRTNLSQLVTDIVERFADQMARAHCDVKTAISNDVEGLFDSVRIEQLIGNLLSNALKYAPGKPVMVTLAANDKTAKLIVEDHGSGIPPEKRVVVFERFERATDNRYVSGLGLGLFIVSEIAKGHHGSVDLETSAGGGARFIINLPLQH